MLLKTRGIVFRTIKYKESSLIADIYTEQKGLQKYIINGVRTKKAKINASLVQLLSLVDMVVYFREGKEINRIKEIKAAYVYMAIPFDLKRGAIALFLAELVQKSIKEAEENTPLFQFLFSAFQHLDQRQESVSNFHLCFLLRLASYLGFQPGNKETETQTIFDLKEGIFLSEEPLHAHFLDPELSQVVAKAINLPLQNCHELSISRTQRKELLRQLLVYYKLHLEQLSDLNSHAILEQVLE